MAWGVFYRPAQPTLSHSYSPSYIREYPPYNHRFGPAVPRPPHLSSSVIDTIDPGSPRFRVPLSATILEDPAFSSDPRTHPHFPLANANSFKAPPPKSPRPPPYHSPQALLPLPGDTPPLQEANMPGSYGPPIIHLPPPFPPPSPSPSLSPSPSPPPSSASVSVESDSRTTLSAFTSPTVSPATSYPPSPKLAAPPISPNTPCYLPMTPPDAVNPPSLSPPLPSPDSVNTTYGHPPLAIPPMLNRSSLLAGNKKKNPRKGRMRNLVQRLTNRQNLDRIDELDETDPFGASYHHDGPYEAIGNNLAVLGPPHKHNDIKALRGNSVHGFKCNLTAPSSLSVQYQSTPRISSPQTEAGLFLRLEPGQILRQNTIYTPATSGIGSIPAFSHYQSDVPTRVTQPDHSRSQSVPTFASSLDTPESYKNQSSSASARVPRIHCFGDNIPRIPNNLSPRYDHDHGTYAVHQGKTTSLPPPQQEYLLPKLSSPQSTIVSPPVPPNPASQQTPAMGGAVSAFPPRDPRHRVTRSLDNAGIMDRVPTQSSSSTQDRTLEPPRIRHLPKRLVMPVPLQPQLPQLRYEFPPASHPIIYDEYADELAGSHFEGQPAMYNQGPRLLRKRSSAFPAKMPIPEHVPMLQGNAVPVIENSSTKAGNEAERTKEGTRRRRLSKRKNDN